jgi:hypothetical protein
MDIGGRPSRRSRAGSTAANSPWRLAANSPASMSAWGPGTPRVIRPARYWSSVTVTRVIGCPVSRV